jgi:hypothetical protein
VCTEAVAVVRAVGADFILDRWHVEIVSNNRWWKCIFKVKVNVKLSSCVYLYLCLERGGGWQYASFLIFLYIHLMMA